MGTLDRGIRVVLGAVFAYLYFIGCAGGTCAITSKPLNATLYGSLMGGLLFTFFVPKSKQ